jgi:hypothetical protein
MADTTPTLTDYITLLIPLSIATERVVDIIKNIIPWLRIVKKDSYHESWRMAFLQVIAIVVGSIIARWASGILTNMPSNYILLGILASGGSGFWTSIQGYVSNIKEIKKADAITANVQTRLNVAAIANGTVTNTIKVHDLSIIQEKREDVSTKVELNGSNEAKTNLENAITIANERLKYF